MKERLGRTGTLVLGASLAFAACEQETKPSESTINIQDVMRNGVTITESNFHQFFIKCASADELVEVSEQQDRELFPFIINDPASISIEVDPFSEGSHTKDTIVTKDPLYLISPINGKTINYEDLEETLKEKSSFVIPFFPDSHPHLHIVSKDGMGNKKSEMDVLLQYGDGNLTIEGPGKEIKKTDQIFGIVPETTTDMIFSKVEYVGGQGAYYSSDLSTYATKDGKVMYCSSEEIPKQNQTTPDA